MVIYITPDRREVGSLKFISLDMDLNKSKDFEIIVPLEEERQIELNYFIGKDKSELGGRITGIEILTTERIIRYTGETYRGTLSKKVIKPAGDYTYINGNIADYFSVLFFKEGLIDYIEVITTLSVNNLKLPRYCTVLEALELVAKTTRKRLTIKYSSIKNKAVISFEDIQDFSNSIEINQNNSLHLNIRKNIGGVNHLICLGQGELSNRTVVDLYLDENGNITKTKHFTGIDEVAEVYENNTVEEIELEEKGRERLQELLEKETVSMEVERLVFEGEIGDRITARDNYMNYMISKNITNKIIKISGGSTSIEYSVEE